MESQIIHSALERVENPILVILLVVLMAAVVALWFAVRTQQTRLMDALIQNVTAMTNLNAVLASMKEQQNRIEDRLSSH